MSLKLVRVMAFTGARMAIIASVGRPVVELLEGMHFLREYGFCVAVSEISNACPYTRSGL
jgi:hypothetical protein